MGSQVQFDPCARLPLTCPFRSVGSRIPDTLPACEKGRGPSRAREVVRLAIGMPGDNRCLSAKANVRLIRNRPLTAATPVSNPVGDARNFNKISLSGLTFPKKFPKTHSWTVPDDLVL